MAFDSSTILQIRAHCKMPADYPSDDTITYWLSLTNALIDSVSDNPTEKIAQLIQANKILAMYVKGRGKDNVALRETKIPLISEDEETALNQVYKRTTITRSSRSWM